MNTQKITSLFFEGQQWTPRHDGGTYQAVRVWANGRLVGTVGMGYGYGRQYETFAMDLLADVGLITRELSQRAPWILERTFGVVVYSSLAHVAKRELVKGNVVKENVQLFSKIDPLNEQLFAPVVTDRGN